MKLCYKAQFVLALHASLILVAEIVIPPLSHFKSVTTSRLLPAL